MPRFLESLNIYEQLNAWKAEKRYRKVIERVVTNNIEVIQQLRLIWNVDLYFT